MVGKMAFPLCSEINLFSAFVPSNKFCPGQLFFGSPAAFEKSLIWRMAETSHQGSDLSWIPEAHSWLLGAMQVDTLSVS